MERWNIEACQAVGELGFGSVMLMSGVSVAMVLLCAFGLGLV